MPKVGSAKLTFEGKQYLCVMNDDGSWSLDGSDKPGSIEETIADYLAMVYTPLQSTGIGVLGPYGAQAILAAARAHQGVEVEIPKGGQLREGAVS